MSAQLQPRWLSVEDYLAFEERGEVKREYLNGEIYAIAGASARHNRITLRDCRKSALLKIKVLLNQEPVYG